VRALQHALPGVLIEIVRRQPVTAAKVDFAWRTAVGPTMARAARVALDAEGTLLIEPSDAYWRHEIEQSLSTVRARLDTLLGDAIVRIAVASPRG
jgi:Dna[CI] antecedent, DciA